jgi:hypothetical protein
VDVDSRLAKESRDVLIGLRIKSNQTVTKFKLLSRSDVEIPTKREGDVTPSPNIATQLTAVAPPATDEKWVGYVAAYNPRFHGKNGFKTEIEVNPFGVPANGFQEVAVAFTYRRAGNEFSSNNHYVIGTSIWPGSNAEDEPVPEHTPREPAVPKKKATTAKSPKKARRGPAPKKR